nr:E3 ubiquitin-protein ligase FANCL [Pelodiscus sinensis]|eukprot:XP_014428626.1 E3 ubiquitin-protein ligase FANCL [Pelodiscus sinensis]
MVELKTILEAALKNAQELHVPPPPEYYSSLVRDIETLGWDKVVYIDTGLNTIKLKGEDSCGRQHLITLKLNAKYPAEPPDCFVDFPVEFAVSWIPQSSLIDIYSQFLAALESLKEFWNAMDEIDKMTWVLEPENPTRSATMRRIAIGNNVSVNLEVDPRHPTTLPECYFLGADHAVNPLRTKLNNNMHLWDPDITLIQNLKDVLETDFPSRAMLEKTEEVVWSGVLFTIGSARDGCISAGLGSAHWQLEDTRISLWTVVSVMLIDLMVLFQTKCVAIPDVGNLSTRLACLSGYKVFLLADRVLMSSLVNVHIVTSQSQ